VSAGFSKPLILKENTAIPPRLNCKLFVAYYLSRFYLNSKVIRAAVAKKSVNHIALVQHKGSLYLERQENQPSRHWNCNRNARTRDVL